ncbi:MAG: hypothetical protein ACP5FH_09290, partial [Terracidiphilus sp.]
VHVEMDPTQQFLVAISRAAAPAQSGAVSGTARDATPYAEERDSAGTSGGAPGLIVRIVRRSSGQVLLVSRTDSMVHLPINAEGYIESQRGLEGKWWLTLDDFSGGSFLLGQIDSTCAPRLDFLSEGELLASSCAANGGNHLIAMTTAGRRLWEARTPPTDLWPRIVRAPDGRRLARETLVLARPVHAGETLDPDEIRGQLVEILDAADGKVEMRAATSPVLDAGGNVAISPSGRRVALLAGGAIQVFELPLPAAPLAESSAPAPLR